MVSYARERLTSLYQWRSVCRDQLECMSLLPLRSTIKSGVDEAVETLNGIRGDEQVDLFWTKVTTKAGAVDVGEPALPRRRKAPIRFDYICCAEVTSRKQLRQRTNSNCSCWTLISMLWQYMERWIYFTWKSTFCHSARDSGRTSPVHSRHSCNECYIGEIVHCATSQKLLAHHDATGTSALSDVAARSQGMNRCSGHASNNSLASRSFGAASLQRIKYYLSSMSVTTSVV